ncbi:ATP-binding cassette transporter subfamily C member 5a isoform X1 [Strongylocentrotus purpuratus]|uniref:ATP-binding cassette transporter subfamily C member 5a n=1 Tax=Strongylocentrotus purpuratus TaxID=7668 RepID=H9CNL1_STRPU|nr:ATP-binding cassette transporter subfamily C member 5a [Strongylocentrotus purpuratus]XP_030839914.1 ATP-binding cassette transporter subfamily C member 5a isoform X1 [Strongylocentrotus purpuratus]AFC36360.1 ATP-binding cassette transporter subfamily C member 5a [Strongylocentrotus purpuratus]|eukprot:NP_001268689.1 ATP-binding cassette transporter subfamily C member 5a [Strongylocentrotus purpuratus]
MIIEGNDPLSMTSPHRASEGDIHNDEGFGVQERSSSLEDQTVIEMDSQIDTALSYTDGKTPGELKDGRIGEQEDDPDETEQLLDKREEGDTEEQKSSNTGTKYWATGNFISVVTSQWLTPLFRAAKKRGLNDDDLYHILPVDSAEKNAKIFAQLWEEEIKHHGGNAVKASLRRVILRFVSWRILGCMLMVMLSQMTVFLLSSVSIRGLLQYSADATAPVYRGILYAVSAMLFTILYNITLGANYFIAASTGVRLRGGVVALLLQKVLRLRGLHKTSMGEIVNLCVNDGNRLHDGMVFTPLVVGAPVIFICACVFTTYILGKSALIGMLVYALTYIAQFALTGGKVIYRARMMKETDQRVHTISEMLTNIKFIKMYAWEDCFERKVNELRRRELRHLVGLRILHGIQKSFNIFVPIVAVVATIMFKLFLKESLSPDQVLTYLAVIYSMRSMLTMTQYGFQYLSDILVSIPRIKNLLIQDEMLPITDSVDDWSNAIEMNSVSAAWDDCSKDKKTQCDTARDKEDHDVIDRENGSSSDLYGACALNDVSVAVKKGSLVGVCGSIGSGKTSLLHTILQQTHILEGSIAVSGSLAYTSQQPDIFNATLRENITMFGDHCEDEVENENQAERVHSEERYWEAVRVCCLSDDIAALPCGGRTEIGERGINLSGGQKHRVSLARAVYADRDIYLLDDPLSAVDTRVAEHIYTECIAGILKEKTVLLVTTNLQYLSKCDEVIVISNGRVIEQGTHTQLMTDEAEYARLLRTFGSDHDKTADDYISKQNEDESTDNDDLLANCSTRTLNEEDCLDENIEGQLVDAETQKQGAVSTGTYLAYFKYAGGILSCFLSLLLYILSPASAAFNNVWLSHWLSAGSGIPQNGTQLQSEDEQDILKNPEFHFFRDVYLYSFLSVFVICSLRIVYYVMITQRASFNLHRSLYKQVFSCPMEFFDTTPSGRVLNRFSRDIDEADNEVPNALETALWTFLSVFAGIVIVIMVFPWFIVFVAIIAIVLVYLSRMFLPAIRDIKRIENIKRSPLIGHVKATVEAQTTIRAFGMGELFIKRCNKLLDTSAVPKMLFLMGQRWLAFRLDLCVAVAQLLLGLSVVFTHNTTAAAFAGLALAYSVQFLGTLQFSVRLITITQARFTSIERITDYIKRLIPEGGTGKKHILKSDVESWPKHGNITVDSLQLKYRDNLPTVLKGISFHVNSKEKIGIVGRTGSGKSSIAVALFRLVEATSGRIHIDDLDIGSIRIRELRSRISVIPQDPVLFTGTLRFNLDPYEQYSGAQIWDALDKTYMKKSIAGIQQQLEVRVRENGSNFSTGERQLLCLARALLRNSTILFLDEATATVDAETDSLVQSTIRTAFSNCTVLTIAHRLHTVLDSDRILVLDDGTVLEMDTPAALLANPDSRLNALLSSGHDVSVNQTNHCGHN